MAITKEECIKVARLFTNRTDFHNKKRKYFDFAKKNGIMAEATAHMENRYRKSAYSKEHVLSIAKKYGSVSEFKKEQRFFYFWVVNHKCQEEAFAHMEKCGNKYKRCIYAYEFSDNFCYVGLTFNLRIRDIQHRTDKHSPVYLHAKNSCTEIPNPVQLTNYIDKDMAAEKEGFFCNMYRMNGWSILNKAKTGALGNSLEEKTKYTKEFCVEYAKQFDNRKKLEMDNRYLYHKILKRGWAEEAFAHLDNEKIEANRRKKISFAKKGKRSTIPFDKASKQHSKRKVIQMTESGEKLNVFNNPNDAARKVFKDEGKNTSIRNCCKGMKKSFGGFLWKYEE